MSQLAHSEGAAESTYVYTQIEVRNFVHACAPDI